MNASIGQMRDHILLEGQRRFHGGSSIWTELTNLFLISERQGLRIEGRKGTPKDTVEQIMMTMTMIIMTSNGDFKHPLRLTMFQILF